MIFFGIDLFLNESGPDSGSDRLLRRYFHSLSDRYDRAPITMTVYLAHAAYTDQWQITGVWTILEMMSLMRQDSVWGTRAPLRQWLFHAQDDMLPLMNAFGPRPWQFEELMVIQSWFETKPLIPNRSLSLVDFLPTDTAFMQLEVNNGRIPSPHPPSPAHSLAAHRS